MPPQAEPPSVYITIPTTCQRSHSREKQIKWLSSCVHILSQRTPLRSHLRLDTRTRCCLPQQEKSRMESSTLTQLLGTPFVGQRLLQIPAAFCGSAVALRASRTAASGLAVHHRSITQLYVLHAGQRWGVRFVHSNRERARASLGATRWLQLRHVFHRDVGSRQSEDCHSHVPNRGPPEKYELKILANALKY
jgi:hypothetical protein